MLDKMFDESIDGEDFYQTDPLGGEPIAGGVYLSDTELIMSGFRLFQKRYGMKNIIIQLILIALAIGVQIAALVIDRGAQSAWALIGVCVALAVIIVLRPRKIAKDLENNIKELEGTKYSCIVYPLAVKISTEQDRIDFENREKNGETDEDEEIPATVIHLDNPAVEIVEDSDKYLLYIKKSNMYVIPKSAFSDEDNKLISERLQKIMGIRYKV